MTRRCLPGDWNLLVEDEYISHVETDMMMKRKLLYAIDLFSSSVPEDIISLTLFSI